MCRLSTQNILSEIATRLGTDSTVNIAGIDKYKIAEAIDKSLQTLAVKHYSYLRKASKQYAARNIEKLEKSGDKQLFQVINTSDIGKQLGCLCTILCRDDNLPIRVKNYFVQFIASDPDEFTTDKEFLVNSAVTLAEIVKAIEI